MEKTAMQELIDMYKSDLAIIEKDYMSSKSIVILREVSTLKAVITNLESALEKEKQQIMEAFDDGFNKWDSGDDYYNNKYVK